MALIVGNWDRGGIGFGFWRRKSELHPLSEMGGTVAAQDAAPAFLARWHRRLAKRPPLSGRVLSVFDSRWS